MNHISRSALLVSFLLGHQVCSRASEPAAMPSPEIFAPGVVSGPANDGSPTFTPDGNTLCFTRSSANWSIIVESHRDGGHWSKPSMATFSGEWPDSSPGFSPDGSYLVYVSLRPPSIGDTKSGDAVANLWRVDRVGSGWGAPSRLPAAVNIGDSIWKPSMASDGTIYFVSIDHKGGKRLFCSRFVAGTYQMAQPLPFSDGTLADVDPEISPDGSFLVFCSSGRTPNCAKDRLFIVLRKGSSWGPVTAIHYSGDKILGFSDDQEPHLGPDRRTLYFSSDRSVPVKFPRSPADARRDLERLESWDNSNSNVWSVALTPWLEAN
jgi:Tol biopolymer transport system component